MADTVTLLDLAQQAAAHLGPGSRAEPHPKHTNTVRIIDDEGRGILIRSHRPDRLMVTASLPEAARDFPAVRIPTISVSLRGGPQHLANHIRRRLLPLHTEALAQLNELITRRDAEQAAREKVTTRLAEALPGAFATRIAPECRTITTITFEGHPTLGFLTPLATAEVKRYGESVSLSLTRLTPDEAEAVLRTLAGMERWR